MLKCVGKVLIILCGSVFSLFGDPYVAKDFSYLKQKMPKIHSELFDVHFKLYQGYVNQCNTLEVLLKGEGNKSSFTFQEIKRRFGWEYDGMVLHELYFENLGGNGRLPAKSPLREAIVKEFGSYDAWLSDFKATCLVRGIGWAILYFDPTTSKIHNVWVQEHNSGPLIGEIPLLVVDMWEHAYLCQFGLKKTDYIDIILSYIDWAAVEARMKGEL